MQLREGGAQRIAARRPSPRERCEKVDGCRGARDPLVILRAGLETLRRFVRRRSEPRHVERLDEILLSPQDPDVRAVELVGRAAQEVAVERGDVDQVVRGVVHGVDEHASADRAGELRGLRDVGDGAERVGRRVDGEQPGARGDRRLERIPVDAAAIGMDADHPRGDAAVLLQRRPRRHVAVVIDLRDHHLVALAPLAAERAREVEGERRHVLAERDLVGAAVHEVGDRPACRRDERVGLLAGGVLPVGVRVVMEQVVGHGIHDFARHLGAARSVEVRHGVAVVHALERGKVRADLLDGCDGRHAISTPAHCSTMRTIST
jgi:hypothetical protein